MSRPLRQPKAIPPLGGGPVGKLSPRELLVAAGIAAVTFAFFLPSLHCGWVNWDDQDNFLFNPNFRGFTGSHVRWMLTAFHQGHYQPLSWLTLAGDYALWGMHATGYHFTNVLLHAACAGLSFLLIRSILVPSCGSEPEALVPDPRRARHSVARASGSDSGPARANQPTPGARIHETGAGALLFPAAVALLWAIHPLRVEAVTWITERREVLCAALTLLALLHHVRGGRWWGTALLSLFAMSAKATAVLIPVLLVLLDLRKSGPPVSVEWLTDLGRALLRHVVVIGLAGLTSYVAVLAQRDADAMIPISQLSELGRITLFFHGVGFYLQKTIWPTGLAPLHEGQEGSSWILLPWVYQRAIVTAVFVAAALVVAWLARRRAPAALYALIAYLAMILPIGGLGQSGPQIAADRYTYQPGLVLTVGLLALAAELLRRIGIQRRALATCTVLLLSASGALVVRQQRFWRDDEALWNRQIAVYPTSALGHFNLGGDAQTMHAPPDLAEAERHYRNAIAAYPDYVLAHTALADLLRKTGRHEDAVVHFKAALATQPDYLPAVNGSAMVQWDLGHHEEAVALFQELTHRDPNSAEAHRSLAKASAAAGHPEAAVRAFERAVSLPGASPDCLFDFAWLLSTNPEDRVRDGRRAVELVERARSNGKPVEPSALVAVAAAYVEAGEFDRARQEVQARLPTIPDSLRPVMQVLLKQVQERQPVRSDAVFP